MTLSAGPERVTMERVREGKERPTTRAESQTSPDMLAKTNILLLLAAAAFAAKVEDKLPASSKDQESANDQVTSILVQPGPNGPRHVILSDEHQVVSSGGEGFSSRHGDHCHYPTRANNRFQHTAPPPLHHVTYGPAKPVAVSFRKPQQSAQLYHHRFAQRSKLPHVKAGKGDEKGLSEAIYKYSTYIKHDKSQEFNGDVDNSFVGGEHDKPDYSVVTADREDYSRQPQSEGLSAYRNRHEYEETKFRESIGDLYSDNFEKGNDYEPVKNTKPLPYSKLYFSKQHSYIPNNVNDNSFYTPEKGYKNQYNSFVDSYHDKPSGFDDSNGGKVAPVLARFYKQPLPIIQTQLPPDSTGLFIQYYQPHKFNYDSEEYASNNYEQYPQEKASLSRNYHTSDSEWTPINAPDGAVPAKSYDIPAPDLSQRKAPSAANVWRNTDNASVVLGKNKQSLTSNHHIQSNSEGVVSAVVRVKQ